MGWLAGSREIGTVRIERVRSISNKNDSHYVDNANVLDKNYSQHLASHPIAVASHPDNYRSGGTMQILFRPPRHPFATALAKIVSPVRLHRPDSLYVSIAFAAGLLWLALTGF